MWQRWNQTTHIFEKSTNDGLSWTPLGLNASIITEGTIHPDRLPAGGGGADLEYSGDYVPATTYNDGDIVVGADGVTYMCVKSGVTTPPEPWPSASNVAFTNLINQFIVQQRISNAGGDQPRLTLTNVGGAANKKHFQILNFGDALNFWALNDAESAAVGAASIDRGGNISTGGAIRFPPTQVPASGTNDLDDYEEGSWTPFLNGDSGNAPGTTYTQAVGRYVKVGLTVTLYFVVQVNVMGGGASGNGILMGLPFYNDGGVYGAGSLAYFTGLNAAVYGLYIQLSPGLYYTYFQHKNAVSAGIDGTLAFANFKAGTIFAGTVSYRAQA